MAAKQSSFVTVTYTRVLQQISLFCKSVCVYVCLFALFLCWFVSLLVYLSLVFSFPLLPFMKPCFLICSSRELETDMREKDSDVEPSLADVLYSLLK